MIGRLRLGRAHRAKVDELRKRRLAGEWIRMRAVFPVMARPLTMLELRQALGLPPNAVVRGAGYFGHGRSYQIAVDLQRVSLPLVMESDVEVQWLGSVPAPAPGSIFPWVPA